MNRLGVCWIGKTGANRFWFGKIGRDENAWGKHIKAIPRYAKVGQDKLFHTGFQAGVESINRPLFTPGTCRAGATIPVLRLR